MPYSRFFTHHIRAVLLAGVLALSATSGAQAQADDTESAQRHITVTASGSVRAVPDMVLISTGVQTTAKTARDALADNSAAMRRVISRMKEIGIRGRDIATDNLSIQPDYKRTRDNSRPPQVTGYRVNNSVRIRVRDISLLGDVLDQVVRLGANQVGGIQFQVSRAERLRDDARTKAFENARRRAQLFAREGDARLGKVLMIREGHAGFSPRPAAMSLRQARASSVPVEAGTQELSSSVTVTWALR